MALTNSSFSEYGIRVKSRLLELQHNQNWLIEQIKEKLPDMYIDSSVLGRILTGKTEKGKVKDAIDEILGFSELPTPYGTIRFTAMTDYERQASYLADLISEFLDPKTPREMHSMGFDEEFAHFLLANNVRVDFGEAKPAFPLIPLEEVALSVKTFNVCKRAGYNTLNELVSLGEKKLGTISNLSSKEIEELKRAFVLHGFVKE